MKQDNQYHLVYQARIRLSEHGSRDVGDLASLAHSENEEANWKSLKHFSQLDGSALIELVDKVAEHLACRESVWQKLFLIMIP